MKISIITVCYNSANTIRETIESVLSQAQDAENPFILEYIIIDGLSTDNTISIIYEYKSMIEYIVSERDGGIYDAMNKGVRIATGDVIGILNSDDVFENIFVLKDIISSFTKFPNLGAIYGDIVYFRTDNPQKSVRFWKAKKYYDTFFEDGFVIPHPTLFVRKQVYEQVGLYYPDFKISSDYEWMLRAFKIFNFEPLYLNKVLVKMRMGGESTKNLKNILTGNKEIFISWKMNKLKLPKFFFVKRLIYKLKQLIVNEPPHNRD